MIARRMTCCRRLGAGVLLSLAITCLSACARQDGPVPIGSISTGDVPSRAIVERIEAHLARESCVGALSRWARFYRWMPTPAAFNGSLPRTRLASDHEVEVILREAGVFGYRAGRFIEPSPPPLSRNQIHLSGDHRDYRVAFGSYDILTDRLTLESCGPNLNAHPGEVIGHIGR